MINPLSIQITPHLFLLFICTAVSDVHMIAKINNPGLSMSFGAIAMISFESCADNNSWNLRPKNLNSFYFCLVYVFPPLWWVCCFWIARLQEESLSQIIAVHINESLHWIRISVETSHQPSHICFYFLHHTICSACRTNQLFDRCSHFIHRKPFHLVPNPPHFWSGLHCCLPSACELAFEAFHYFYQMLSALLWLFPVFLLVGNAYWWSCLMNSDYV